MHKVVKNGIASNSILWLETYLYKLDFLKLTQFVSHFLRRTSTLEIAILAVKGNDEKIELGDRIVVSIRSLIL